MAHDGESGDEDGREQPEEETARRPVEREAVQELAAEEEHDDGRGERQRERPLAEDPPERRPHPPLTDQGFLNRISPKTDSARELVFCELMEMVTPPTFSPGSSP